MPAAFASGAPIQLCHSVFPMSFLQELANASNAKTNTAVDNHSQHHMHQGSKQSEDHDEGSGSNSDVQSQDYCAFGALNPDQISGQTFTNVENTRNKQIQTTRLRGAIQRQRIRLFQSRAPPNNISF